MTAQELTPEKQTWIDRLVEVLTDPIQAFDRIHAENVDPFKGFAGAAAIAIGVLVLDGLRAAPSTAADSFDWSVAASIAVGLGYWVCLSGLIAILAMCFGRNKQDITGAIVSFGWCFAPWIFMAPLFCLQHALGSFFGVLVVLPATWIVLLQFFALMRNFALKWWQALLLVFIAPALFCTMRILEAVQGLYLMISSCGH